MLFKDILRFYLVFVTQELIAFENDTLKLGGYGDRMSRPTAE